MKALIVYDSMYGNTEKIAQAIGEGLKPMGEVKVIKAGEAKADDVSGMDIVIVGSPTQAGRPLPSVKLFLDSIQAGALKNIKVAAFDTRVKSLVAKIFGYAAGKIADDLKGKGGNAVADPGAFFVGGSKGPLADKELERAKEWGKKVGEGKG
jgi:flavodoxin I